MRTLVISLLAAVLLCTCEPALEIREETDDLGYRTEYQVDPETGEREGYLRIFDPAENLVVEENYRQGTLQGTRYSYYPNGEAEIEETYLNGNFEGIYRTYDSLGTVRMEGYYTDGAMNGKWFRFYPNGATLEEVTFVDNKENGPFREWYEDGEPKAAGTYRNGDKEDGILHMFAEDGKLERIMQCEMAACSTIWRVTEGGQAPIAPPDMGRPSATTR